MNRWGDYQRNATRFVLVSLGLCICYYPFREVFDAGGLMSYEANIPAIRRQVGVYVDKIFKGAKPGG